MIIYSFQNYHSSAKSTDINNTIYDIVYTVVSYLHVDAIET